MEQSKNNKIKINGFRLTCLSCGNTIVFPFDKHQRHETDNISIYSYSGHNKAVSIICDKCQSETILY